jgi:hypothetical protein
MDDSDTDMVASAISIGDDAHMLPMIQSMFTEYRTELHAAVEKTRESMELLNKLHLAKLAKVVTDNLLAVAAADRARVALAEKAKATLEIETAQAKLLVEKEEAVTQARQKLEASIKTAAPEINDIELQSQADHQIVSTINPLNKKHRTLYMVIVL